MQRTRLPWMAANLNNHQQLKNRYNWSHHEAMEAVMKVKMDKEVLFTEIQMAQLANKLEEVNINLIFYTSSQSSLNGFLRVTNVMQKRLPKELFFDHPESMRKLKEWGLRYDKRTYMDYMLAPLVFCTLPPTQNFEATFGAMPNCPEETPQKAKSWYRARVQSVRMNTFHMELLIIRYEPLNFEYSVA